MKTETRWILIVTAVLLGMFAMASGLFDGNEVVYEGDACRHVQHEWYEVTGEDVRHVSYCTINDRTGQLRLRFTYEEVGT